MLRERREAQVREQQEAERRRQEAIAERQRLEYEAREKQRREERLKLDKGRQEWNQRQRQQEPVSQVRAAEAKQEAERKRLERNRQSGGGNVSRNVGGDSARWEKESGSVKEPFSSNQRDTRQGQAREQRGRDTRQQAQRQNREQARESPFARSQPQPQQQQRRDNPFAGAQQPRQQRRRDETSAQQQPRMDSLPAERTAQPAARVAMPSFGSSSGAAQEEQAQPAESGWGSGGVERAPLKYGEEFAPRPNENIGSLDEGAQSRYGDRGRPNAPTEALESQTLFDRSQAPQQPYAPEQRPSRSDYNHQRRYSAQRSQDFGRRGQHDQQESYSQAAQQRPHRAEQQNDGDFIATLSGSAQQGLDGWRQRGDFSSIALDAAFAGSGLQQQSRISRNPMEYRSGGAQQDVEGTRGGEDFPSFGTGEQSQAGAYQQHDQGWPATPQDEYRWDQAPRQQQNSDAFQQDQDVPYRPTQLYQRPPPPQAPHYANQKSSYNDSGYQATMFDPDDYQQPAPRFDEDQSANWQHVRRRNSEPPPPPRQPASQQQQQQQYQTRRQPIDDDWVNQSFEEHRQQRSQQQSFYQPSPFDKQIEYRPTNNPRRTPNRGRQVCGRCQEEGHVARDCRGPIRAKCNSCGQVGHFERDCPTNSQNPAVRGRQQQWDQQQQQQREKGAQQSRVADPWAQRRSASEPGVIRRTRSQALEETPFPERKGRAGVDQVFDAKANARSRFDEERDEVSVGGGRDRRARRGVEEPEEEEGDAVSDMRDRVLRPSKRFEEAEEEGEEGEERRTLRSRKFVEDTSKREKAGRGRRRDEDEEEDDEGGAERDERNARKAMRRQKEHDKREAKAAERKAKVEAARSQINLPEFVNVATLAQTLGVRYESFVSRLERLGYDDVFPGKILNAETSGMIAMEYDFEPIFESTSPEADERDLKPRPEVEDKSFLPTRPPVVTIMGHVDHGKTTILDYLRKSSVAAGEAGGITQHIGAFSVPLASSGKTITFLDTPGHAAFLAMRQRGANVTDIVILVVAADDSVKPQTLEAIKHAKAAGVPMIVAVNKIDKEEADLQRVKQDLARHGVEIEDYGGETQVVPVSGKTGVGMDELEENVVTLSEILDHRAENDGMVEGWVLEATTKKAGRVATVLVRRGTLRPGAVIVAGKTWARVRTLRNEGGQSLREIGPGMPVEVDGWRDQPMAGDEVLQAPTEQKASDVVEFRLEKAEREKTAVDMEAINEARKLEQDRREKEKAAQNGGGEDYFEAAARGDEVETNEAQTGQMTVPFIIKADVSGSAEAVSAYIMSVSSPLIAPRLLRSQVGPINGSDVELADAARGHIISFNLPPDEGMKGAAEAKGVKVLENNIIYRVLDDVKAVLEEKLPPVVSQRVLGEAEISAAFEIGVGGRKKVKIAGCKVRNGIIGRGSRVRVTRGAQKIYDGE